MVGKVIAKNPEFELILELDETDGQWKCSIPVSYTHLTLPTNSRV